uniref:Nuclear transcription factor Y subunit gamma n=2 Tax=Cacopsylla melanoneura TaxID=428564 RepID=A0A8D8S7S3_9HEMI
MSVFLLNQESEEDVDNPLEIDPKQHPQQTMLALSGNVNEAQDLLNAFWPKVTEELRSIRQLDLKNQALPLARIKKIMKLDDGVKMISAEAPMLFSKAAELFINELTLRAWIHTEDNKRRTLQRNDIAMAITKYDMFDFLIDIVPREEVKAAAGPHKRDDTTKTALNPDQVQYYFQLAQQHQAALQGTSTGGVTNTTPTLVVNGGTNNSSGTSGQQIQTVTVQCPTSGSEHTQGPAHIIQIQNPAGSNGGSSQNNGTSGTSQTIQLVQQIISPTGEIQQIPIQLNGSQLQMIRGNGNQPIIITTGPGQTQQLIQVSATSPTQN